MSGVYSPGYRGPSEIHYLFVDAGSLRGKLRNVAERYFPDFDPDGDLKIDFKKLVVGYTKVFYYDALPVIELGESSEGYEERIRPQKEVLDAAAGVDGIMSTRATPVGVGNGAWSRRRLT